MPSGFRYDGSRSFFFGKNNSHSGELKNIESSQDFGKPEGGKKGKIQNCARSEAVAGFGGRIQQNIHQKSQEKEKETLLWKKSRKKPCSEEPKAVKKRPFPWKLADCRQKMENLFSKCLTETGKAVYGHTAGKKEEIFLKLPLPSGNPKRCRAAGILRNPQDANLPGEFKKGLRSPNSAIGSTYCLSYLLFRIEAISRVRPPKQNEIRELVVKIQFQIQFLLFLSQKSCLSPSILLTRSETFEFPVSPRASDWHFRAPVAPSGRGAKRKSVASFCERRGARKKSFQ